MFFAVLMAWKRLRKVPTAAVMNEEIVPARMLAGFDRYAQTKVVQRENLLPARREDQPHFVSAGREAFEDVQACVVGGGSRLVCIEPAVVVEVDEKSAAG